MLKNDPVASRRRVYLQITSDVDGSAAPRGTDFTGCSWLDASTGQFFATSNRPVNSRRELTFATFTFTVDHTADHVTGQVHAVAHPFETGDGPVPLSVAGGALAAPLSASGSYYIIVRDADHFDFAATLADAYSNTPITLTDDGSGVQSVVHNPSFFVGRGLDGDFMLQLEQAELNFDGDYLLVRVEKAGYLARSWVKMENAGGVLGTVITADGKTVDDVLRFLYATDGAGEIDKDPVTGELQIWNETHTKVIATCTLTANGRHLVAVNANLGL